MSDLESSDDDYEGLLKKALAVELPANFNPNSVPKNGEEYLHHVIYERNKCKKLVTANIDYKKLINKQTFRIPAEKITRKAPEHCQPTKDWQNTKIEDFAEFRKYVHSKISTEPTLSSFDEETFIEKTRNETPFFSYITQYSQSSKIRMLQMITQHINSLKPGESIEDNLGSWIYAILALLEIPLSPDYCYTLREFARKCTIVRSNLPDNVDESLYIPLNLYICLISRYFDQLDLAD